MGNWISNLVWTFDVYRLYNVILSFLLNLTRIYFDFNLIWFFSSLCHMLFSQPLNPTVLLMTTSDLSLYLCSVHSGWLWVHSFPINVQIHAGSVHFSVQIITLLFKKMKTNTQLSLSTSCTQAHCDHKHRFHLHIAMSCMFLHVIVIYIAKPRLSFYPTIKTRPWKNKCNIVFFHH